MALIDRVPEVILAEFDSAGDLIGAARKLREAGYKKYDCHSPFPIHGMDAAMGLKRSPLGFLIAACGTTGLVGATLLQWWTSAVDYPLVISGKEFFSFQAFVPVAFALTVLLSALGATFGMFALNKLPRLSHPVFNSERFKKFSDDGFFVSVEATDPKYDAHETARFLESIGGKQPEVLKD